MKDCLFCKMIAGEIPCQKVVETDFVLGFKDIYPQAKEHYLFISKNHSKNINEMKSEDIISIYDEIKKFTQENNLEKEGFRVVSNINQHGCQSVFHTHFHVLGGEQLSNFGS